MKHFLRLLVTRRWGWVLIAILILVVGVLWGVSSPTASYIGPPGGSDAHLYTATTSNGDVYIYPVDKSTFFIARHGDFSPPIDPTQIHMDILLNFLARPDMAPVNDTIAGNLHVTQAHIIEKLVLYNLNDTPIASYTTGNYNPNGYYESRWWPGAIALIITGLLIASIALFVRSKRRKSVPFVPATPGIPPAPGSQSS